MSDEEDTYDNITITNSIDKQTRLNTVLNTGDNLYRAERVRIEISSSTNDLLDESIRRSPDTNNDSHNDDFSESIDGNDSWPLSALSQPIQQHNSTSNSTFQINEREGYNTDIIHSYVFQRYFPRWYLERHRTYPSMATNPSTYDVESKPEENSNDCQPMMVNRRQNEKVNAKIQQIYGIDDDIDLLSTASSESALNDELENCSQQNVSQSISTTYIDSKPAQRITIREHRPTTEMSSSSFTFQPSSTFLSKQRNTDNNQHEQLIESRTELNNDPNPKIIRQPNPQQVTYKQNISIRYLSPPTPPPRPLIVREIVPPPPPSPPPLIINSKHVEPRTPSTEIIREAPPTPPSQQQPQIITKVLSQQSAPLRHATIEQNVSLPPKPQSIIIEKWLPYKPQPPREVIYERVVEAPMVCKFQPGFAQKPYLCTELDNAKSSVFDHIAWQTQQELEALERQTFEQEHAAHQPATTSIKMPSQTLTTPALVVNYPPVTRTINRNELSEEEQNYFFCQPIYMCASY